MDLVHNLLAIIRRDWRSTAWWLVWLGLVTVWVDTLIELSLENQLAYPLLALLAIALLVILFFAEGMELAASDLMDKQPEQIEDNATRRVLADIQRQRDFFFSHRQVFVVLIIAFMSLVTNYPWIAVPFLGRITDHGARFWFTFLLTTLTILWFCQVTPKRLAIKNSERFLGQSRPVWYLIKAISVIGLPNPSSLLVKLLDQVAGYGNGRHLLPSGAAHYNVAAHRYGFGLHGFETQLSIQANGSGRVREKFLMLFLHGKHTQLYGYLETPARFVSEPEVRLLALWTAPVPERFELIAGHLDVIFQGKNVPSEARFKQRGFDEWKHKVTLNVVPSLVREGSTWGEKVTWKIEGEALPESLWDGSAHGEFLTQPLVALLYEVDAEVADNSFATSGDDEWSETIALACGFYSISVSSQPQLALAIQEYAIRFGHSIAVDDSIKYTTAAISRKGSVRVPYPLQGTTHTLRWRLV